MFKGQAVFFDCLTTERWNRWVVPKRREVTTSVLCVTPQNFGYPLPGVLSCKWSRRGVRWTNKNEWNYTSALPTHTFVAWRGVAMPFHQFYFLKSDNINGRIRSVIFKTFFFFINSPFICKSWCCVFKNCEISFVSPVGLEEFRCHGRKILSYCGFGRAVVY